MIHFITQILGWAVLSITTWGLLYGTKKVCQSNNYTTPIITISFVAITVYLGGIVGALNGATYSLMVLGIIGAISAYKQAQYKKIAFEKLAINRIVFWSISAMFLIFLLTSELEHYDNFSHWAIVVKDMLITEGIPTASSAAIDFKNYPLGTSAFIYYVCKMIGYGEGCMLFAQGLLIFSCIYAVFGIIEEKKRFLLYGVLGCGLAALAPFNISIRINTLLVDFILPILTLAIIAVIYQYRNRLSRGYVAIFPMLSLLVIVKNIGILFAVIAMLYLGYAVWHYPQAEASRWRVYLGGIVTAVGSLFTTVIWHWHMHWRFQSVTNKFETDVVSLQEGLSQKTPQVREAVTDLFIETVMDVRFMGTLGIILFSVLALVAVGVAHYVLKKKWYLSKMVFIGLMGVGIYHVGILGMYLFSMPTIEALNLAGLERYVSSIVILYGGLLVMCLTLNIEDSFAYKIGDVADYKSFRTIETKKYYNQTVVALSAVAFMIISSEYNGLQYVDNQYDTTTPYQIKQLVGDRWEAPLDETPYLVYASDVNEQVSTDYVRYMMRYYLYAKEVNVFYDLDSQHTQKVFERLELPFTSDEQENLSQLMAYHDTLIVLDTPDQATQQLIAPYLVNDKVEAGIYPLKD